MKYSTMARIARKMQKVVESELTRLHGECLNNKKPVGEKIAIQRNRAKLVVLNGGKPK